MNAAQTVELLPCPFCGREDIEAWEAQDSNYHSCGWDIGCICGFNSSSGFNTKELAIKAWNTRSDTRLQQRVKELEGVCGELVEALEILHGSCVILRDTDSYGELSQPAKAKLTGIFENVVYSAVEKAKQALKREGV